MKPRQTKPDPNRRKDIGSGVPVTGEKVALQVAAMELLGVEI